jgi:hypothetical protein
MTTANIKRDVTKLEVYLSDLSCYFKHDNRKSCLQPMSCASCGKIFESRTKLFKHLSEVKHAQMGVSPRGYVNKYEHTGDEMCALNFVRWLIRPVLEKAHKEDACVPGVQVNSVKECFSEMTNSMWFASSYTVTSSFPHVLSAKLDCGVSVLTLIVARCILAESSTRPLLISLCKAALPQVNIQGA